MKYIAIPASVLLFLAGLGCGGVSIAVCGLIGVNVSPQSATIDHTAIINFQHFDGFPVVPAGCITTQSNLVNVTWVTSDPADVSISNIHDQTFGNATCLHATPGPVTITATAPAGNGGTVVSGTAKLTCN